MDGRLAVLLIHGVEINNKNYAETATKKLKDAFWRNSRVDADEALVIRPAFWAPVLQENEDKLLRRVGANPDSGYFRWLNRMGTRADRGSGWAVSLAAASALLPWFPRWPWHFRYPTLRWLTVNYLGDAIAYQITESDRVMYDRVHAAVATTLRELSKEAGKNAPLCVIAHSLGTVVASNFFYDLQMDGGFPQRTGRKLVSHEVKEELGDSALERGETLAFFYTLGSPLALWTLRQDTLDAPLKVPDPRCAQIHPDVKGEWVNVYDPDDVIASPLKGLSKEYCEQVAQDRSVSVGPFLLGWTPLAHPFYWNDDRVLEPIGRSLAQAWEASKRGSREVGA